ncbi:MAG: symmetrical bis(5'-nucleosyl)-tetraphosphatase [Pseudomonadota bacterium]
MASYVIGDIQGCLVELEALLRRIDFSPRQDQLYFVGDLVNRGPNSLEVLRLVVELGDSARTVLGNHDLHLLACAHTPNRRSKPKDTFEDILNAADADRLLHWVRQQPLLLDLGAARGWVVHAGLYPGWDLNEAQSLAREVEGKLRSADFTRVLSQMYGDKPATWSHQLQDAERWRFVLNVLTRIRFCNPDGSLNLAEKGAAAGADAKLIPWYAVANRKSVHHAIYFGHWSTLRVEERHAAVHNVYPLDTGAVWGGALTAICVETGERTSVPASANARSPHQAG